MLCDSLILSHFNYCDFLYGPTLDSNDKRRIQLVQNWCVRLIFGLKKFDRGISTKIKLLKWLRMEDRVKFHLGCYVYKLFYLPGHHPLKDRFTHRHEVHSVNVRSKMHLTMPKFSLSIFKKSFTYNTIKIFNCFARKLYSLSFLKFKSQLKTHLLSSASY